MGIIFPFCETATLRLPDTSINMAPPMSVSLLSALLVLGWHGGLGGHLLGHEYSGREPEPPQLPSQLAPLAAVLPGLLTCPAAAQGPTAHIVCSQAGDFPSLGHALGDGELKGSCPGGLSLSVLKLKPTTQGQEAAGPRAQFASQSCVFAPESGPGRYRGRTCLSGTETCTWATLADFEEP